MELFVGTSGNYQVEDLDRRIEMLEILREEVALINYGLKRLQQEIIIGVKAK